MSKRILSLVLAMVMVLGTFGTVFAATGNDKVDALIEAGLVKGNGSDYNLGGTITREEMATMLVRMMGKEEVALAMTSIPTAFTDVKAGHWSNGYVAVAVAEGLTRGTSETTFSPAKAITNAEVITFLVRLAGLEKEGMVYPTGYIMAAIEAGITNGSVDMAAPATREVAFEMMYNTLENAADEAFVASPENTVVEAIVVETARTSDLLEEEVIVKVLAEIQRSSLDKDERYEYEELTLNMGTDSTDLLGVVLNIELNRKEEVVNVELSKSYKYEVKTNVNPTKLKYTEDFVGVVNNERIPADEDVVLETNVEYARYTTKNNRVVFIDAFELDADSAIVLEDSVYNKKTEEYDIEVTEDSVEKTFSIVEDALVINVTEGFEISSLEEIYVNDVLHLNAAEGIVFVLSAEASVIEGTLTDVRTGTAKEGVAYVVEVEDEEYGFDVVTYINGTTITEMTNAITSLATGTTSKIDKEVALHFDMFGNIIAVSVEATAGSNTSKDYAVVLEYDGEFQLLLADGSVEWFAINRSTKFADTVANTETGNDFEDQSRAEQIKAFEKGTLISYTMDEEVLTKVVLEDQTEVTLTKLTAKLLETADMSKFVGKDALVFVADEQTVMTVADFVKTYERPVKAQIITNTKDAQTVEVVIVREEVKTLGSTAATGSVIVEVSTISATGFRATDGTRYTMDKAATGDALTTLSEGDIIRITLVKDTDNVVKTIAKDIFAIYSATTAVKPSGEVEGFTVANGRITLADGSVYSLRDAVVYGGSLEDATKVKFAYDADKYVTILLVVAE